MAEYDVLKEWITCQGEGEVSGYKYMENGGRRVKYLVYGMNEEICLG